MPATNDTRALGVDSVSVKYGAVTALDGVSFDVAQRSVHAVIGPNGAGKSTLFNVLSGLTKPTSGSVHYTGSNSEDLRPHQIAHLGVARTFQNIVLSKSESVFDNLMHGRHWLTKSGVIATGLGLPSARREAKEHGKHIREIADFIGIGPLLGSEAGVLSYGDQKRVELARALCSEPSMLLLDEPVAGMNVEESQDIAAKIVEARDELGVTVLVVEHDMGFVMGMADTITVLSFGKLVMTGSPSTVRNDAAVIDAYLGVGKSTTESTIGAKS